MEKSALDQLVASRPFFDVDAEHILHDAPNVVRIVVRNLRINSLAHALIQVVHVPPAKRRLERQHLVDHAAERPDVRLVAVWLVVPDLGQGVVGRTSLRVVEAVLIGNLANVHISEHGLIEIHAVLSVLGIAVVVFVSFTILEHEDVRGLDVSMHHADLVYGPQSMNRLDEDAPHLTLPKVHFPTPSLGDHLEQIATIRKLHDQIQSLRLMVNEGLLVGDNIWVINTR